MHVFVDVCVYKCMIWQYKSNKRFPPLFVRAFFLAVLVLKCENVKMCILYLVFDVKIKIAFAAF